MFFVEENTSAFVVIFTFLNKVLTPSELYTLLLLEMDRLNLRKSSLVWITDFNNREVTERREGAEMYYFIFRGQAGNINKWSKWVYINREWWACGELKMHVHFKAFKINIFRKHCISQMQYLSAKFGSWTINLQPSCCNSTVISWTQPSFWLLRDEGLTVLFISWSLAFYYAISAIYLIVKIQIWRNKCLLLSITWIRLF